MVALRLFTTALKNIAVELNIFLLTATQISNDDENKNGGFRDFRNIRGSRAIVDLVDFAAIMSRPSVEELNTIAKYSKEFFVQPNLITDIFKNRRGRWNMVRVWSYWDAGTCRKQDLFITDSRLEPLKDFTVFNFITDKEDEQRNEAEINVVPAQHQKIDVNSYSYEIEADITPDMIQDAFAMSEQKLKELIEKDWGELI